LEGLPTTESSLACALWGRVLERGTMHFLWKLDGVHLFWMKFIYFGYLIRLVWMMNVVSLGLPVLSSPLAGIVVTVPWECQTLFCAGLWLDVSFVDGDPCGGWNSAEIFIFFL